MLEFDITLRLLPDDAVKPYQAGNWGAMRVGLIVLFPGWGANHESEPALAYREVLGLVFPPRNVGRKVQGFTFPSDAVDPPVLRLDPVEGLLVHREGYALPSEPEVCVQLADCALLSRRAGRVAVSYPEAKLADCPICDRAMMATTAEDAAGRLLEAGALPLNNLPEDTAQFSRMIQLILAAVEVGWRPPDNPDLESGREGGREKKIRRWVDDRPGLARSSLGDALGYLFARGKAIDPQALAAVRKLVAAEHVKYRAMAWHLRDALENQELPWSKRAVLASASRARQVGLFYDSESHHIEWLVSGVVSHPVGKVADVDGDKLEDRTIQATSPLDAEFGELTEPERIVTGSPIPGSSKEGIGPLRLGVVKASTAKALDLAIKASSDAEIIAVKLGSPLGSFGKAANAAFGGRAIWLGTLASRVKDWNQVLISGIDDLLGADPVIQ